MCIFAKSSICSYVAVPNSDKGGGFVLGFLMEMKPHEGLVVAVTSLSCYSFFLISSRHDET
jgi:hypothetical protein